MQFLVGLCSSRRLLSAGDNTVEVMTSEPVRNAETWFSWITCPLTEVSDLLRGCYFTEVAWVGSVVFT